MSRPGAPQKEGAPLARAPASNIQPATNVALPASRPQGQEVES